MFPGLRQRFDAALDLIVEFSTLGEYRLAAPAAGGRASAPVTALAEAAGSAGCAPTVSGAAGSAGCAPTVSGQGPRLGGAGGYAARAADQQVAGGAVVTARGAAVRAPLRGTAATPAARRLVASTRCPAVGEARGERRAQSSGLHPRRGLERPGAGASQHRVRGGATETPEQLCLAV